MDLHPDFRKLLAEFDRCAVRFVELERVKGAGST